MFDLDAIRDLHHRAWLAGDGSYERSLLRTGVELVAEVERLRGENESLREAADGAMREDRDQLLVQADRFRALLLRVTSRFIKHGVDCALKNMPDGMCDCGVSDLEADIEEALFK